jgi:hypothetical protein
MKSWQIQSSRFRPEQSAPISTSALVVFDARTGGSQAYWGVKQVGTSTEGRQVLAPSRSDLPVWVPAGLQAQGSTELRSAWEPCDDTSNCKTNSLLSVSGEKVAISHVKVDANDLSAASSVDVGDGAVQVTAWDVVLSTSEDDPAAQVKLLGDGGTVVAAGDRVDISGAEVDISGAEVKVTSGGTGFSVDASSVDIAGGHVARVSGGKDAVNGGVTLHVGGDMGDHNGTLTIDYSERGASDGSGTGGSGGQGQIYILNAKDADGNGGRAARILFDTPGPADVSEYHFTPASGTKTFAIPHPLTHLSSTTTLRHACVEAPTVDNVYRGRCKLFAGKGVVSLDSNERYSMTTGTFESLNKDPQVHLSNNESFDRVIGRVVGGELHIFCEDAASDISVDWLVVATRSDQSVRECPNTTADGDLVVEKPRN